MNILLSKNGLRLRRGQQGHAGILTVLILPALWMLFSMGTDGARGLQDKARLDDALEAAVLAVSAHNDENIGTNGSQVNKDIVNAYVNAYVTDKESITGVKITKLDCDNIPDCVSGLSNGDSRFFQYEVTASTKHDSWFSSDENFGAQFDVSGSSISRKYQDNPVDVVFVSDFSGSMDNGWSGGNQDKYKDLRDVIASVTVELQKFNDNVNLDDNTISFVGYNNYTKVTQHNCYLDQLKYKTEVKIRRGKIRVETRVDYSATVNDVFNEKNASNCRTENIYPNAKFNDILPTTNFTTFNSTVNTFRPDGYTASHQGLIRGAQLAMQGTNPRRLIVILSDGADLGDNKVANRGTRSHKGISENLYGQYGLCDKIRNDLNSQTTSDGDDVLSRVAVIGFDYDLDSNKGLKDCAGEDNVFKAQNKTEILAKILELISEEIGHLK
tara:strand:+ start:29 stop:1351 length:1323 start_codon:yes stop_codon:yes gene_type:complete